MFVYEEQQLKSIPCNLCGVDSARTIAESTGNGTSAKTRMCKRCGLIYISPRMTKEGYDNYYKHFYREDRTRSTGHAESAADLSQNFEDARKFGKALAAYLAPHILTEGATIDVGSSTGGVLKGFEDALSKITIFGVEPSLSESGYAATHGVPTRTMLFEDFISCDLIAPSSVANVLCVRSLNHLLDPRAFFEWARRVLKSHGRLVLVVKNFRHQARRASSVASGVQIDHPYMFTPETLRNLVEDAGFKVLYIDEDEHKGNAALAKQKADGLSIRHIRIVAEKEGDEPRPRLGFWQKKKTYGLLRIQFSRPMLLLNHFLFYSRFIPFLRKN